MQKRLSQEEMHWLLKDMAEVCLRPPHGEGERMLSTPVSSHPLGRRHLSPMTRIAKVLDTAGPYSPVLLLALILAPLVALTTEVAFAGPGWTLAGMAVSAAAGAALILKQGRRPFAMLAACLDGLHMGRNVPLLAMRRGLLVVCGLLLLMPDPLTSLAAGVILVPGLRENLADWLQRQTSPRVVLG